MLKRTFRGLSVATLLLAVSACQGVNESDGKSGLLADIDVQAALAALPRAEVVDLDEAGIPSFVTGQLGAVDLQADVTSPEAQVSLREALSTLSPVMRVKPDDLALRAAHVDREGDTHLRFTQYRNGLEVLGGEFLVHARRGRIYAFNGGARGDLEAAAEPVLSPEGARAAAQSAAGELANGAVGPDPRLAYTLGRERLQMVYVVKVTGALEDGTPVNDDLFVDALDGSILRRDSHVQAAQSRAIYTASNGTNLPGSLRLSEGGAAVSDATINSNYARLGTTYDCYKTLFDRDSFDDAGAQLVSSVHVSHKLNNAFWDGSQMIYGDGDGVTMSNLAACIDVTAHELTHAVTSSTSQLVYSGQSGGLNESMSDIMGETCEWFRDGQVVSANTWKVGEDAYTPGTAGDALRYMNDPKADGASLDYYSDYKSNVDVHLSSGISNLVFYLLSQGGKHPRGRSNVVVTGIGIAKAAQIFYKANTELFTSQTTFAAARTATEQAAQQLGYTAAEIASVTAAWQAVGVGGAATPPPSAATPLTNNVATAPLSVPLGTQSLYTLAVPAGATSLTFTTTGGTGDLDLYVRFGSSPTTSTYTCRSAGPTATETCTINGIQTGTYYVLLNAYSAYSGATLKGAYTTSTGGGGGGGGGGGACVHPECAIGAKLASACDPCVTSICAADAYCCSTRWDARCVEEVESICGQPCN